MSKVLIERQSLDNIARKIKRKTSNTAKMKASDMPDRIGVLHGYISSARAFSSDPAATAASTFALEDAGSFLSTSVENTAAPRKKVQSTFDTAASLSFITTAAEAE